MDGYEFATYDDIMEELANDGNDEYDPEFRDPDGYCVHGKYVGGSGADLMCGWCEDGISLAEAQRIVAAERLAKIRERADNAQTVLNLLLMNPRISGMDAAEFAQRSSYICNPRSRYGRH